MVCEIPGGRLDRLLLVVAITVLVSSLQGYAVSLDGLRHQLDPHWQRGIPSRGVQRRQQQPWFTRIELPPRSLLQQAQQPAVA